MEKDFIGLTLEEAKEKACELALEYRKVWEDNYFYIVTRDFKRSRLNFKIENNIIIDCYFG